MNSKKIAIFGTGKAEPGEVAYDLAYELGQVLAEADFLGRTTPEALEGLFEAGSWLLEKAKNLQVSQKGPEPFLQGRDLIKVGLNPSKAFKNILQEAYELQLDGEISSYENALIWLDKTLK